MFATQALEKLERGTDALQASVIRLLEQIAADDASTSERAVPYRYYRYLDTPAFGLLFDLADEGTVIRVVDIILK